MFAGGKVGKSVGSVLWEGGPTDTDTQTHRHTDTHGRRHRQKETPIHENTVNCVCVRACVASLYVCVCAYVCVCVLNSLNSKS